MHIGYFCPEVVAVPNKPAENRERETTRASAEGAHRLEQAGVSAHGRSGTKASRTAPVRALGGDSHGSPLEGSSIRRSAPDARLSSSTPAARAAACPTRHTFGDPNARKLCRSGKRLSCGSHVWPDRWSPMKSAMA